MGAFATQGSNMPRAVVTKPAWRSAILLVLFTAMTQTAAAQGIAGSFEQLQIIVRPGDSVTVTDATGRETTGKIASLSSSTLALLADGARLDLSESDVSTIKQRRDDSLANGALIGLATGAALASVLVIAVAAEDEDVDAGSAALIIGLYGAIGTGIGVGVDALIRGRQVIYQRPSTSGLQVGVAPWLTRQRKGVLVTLRF
jgi:hypothetical protein